VNWPITAEPEIIAAAGDWHLNTPWALGKIHRGAKLLAGQPFKVFLHFGDFGFYPDANDWWARSPYLTAVSKALAAEDAWLLAIDGNHEDHHMLAAIAAADAEAGETPPHEVVPRVFWLPRGYRWTWANRTWVAVGGGVSVNRAKLTEGRDWFPGEQITDEQERAIIAAGPADVIVSHDCPAGAAHTHPPPEPGWDLADLARADVHAEKLQRIYAALRPSFAMHGHLHQGYQRTTDLGWGPVQLTGLDCDWRSDRDFIRDRNKMNTATLSLADMTWTLYD
jgi:hypothetical protein